MRTFPFIQLSLILVLFMAGCNRVETASGTENRNGDTVAAAVRESSLFADLTANSGTTARVYLYAPDERVRVEGAPSCMAEEGDTIREGTYAFYLQTEEGKLMKQSAAPYENGMTFNDSRSMLEVMPRQDQWPSDLLLVKQYGSCSGSLYAVLGLSDDGETLHHYLFQHDDETVRTLFSAPIEALDDGRIRTASYNNARGEYHIVTWKLDEEKQVLLSVEEKKRPLAGNKETLSQETVRSLLVTGVKRFWHVSNGGSGSDTKRFEWEGNMYRYFGEDLDTKRKLMDDLQEVYTKEAVLAMMEKYKWKERDGKMVQPDADFGSLLDWENANIRNVTVEKNRAEVEADVPLGDTGQAESRSIRLLYSEEKGWLLDQEVH